MNKLSNKLGAEAFWPTSLDKESDKAARIRRNFCIDGFMTDQGAQDTSPQPRQGQKKAKRLDHIPPEVRSLRLTIRGVPCSAAMKVMLALSYQVIRNCRGLAIFTVMRVGIHLPAGGGGGGIVVAKMPNGSWSPPSGILIHTMGWGLVAGADIYDCVCAINNDRDMEGFTRVRCTLGGEVSAAVGPLGAGSTVDSEVFERLAPVWTYTKSKGLYVGVQADGTIIVEWTSENEHFYGIKKIRNKQILAGEFQPLMGSVVQLRDAASGRGEAA